MMFLRGFVSAGTGKGIWFAAIVSVVSIYHIYPTDYNTGDMDYDEACKMQLTPGVVHNFQKAVGV